MRIKLGIFLFFLHTAGFAALPGATPYPPALEARLNAALETGKPLPVYTNRLLLEDSPYLRGHAHNPVDWYAWGEEALQRAQRENKPIFLSVGYSTCHWCHVMERESFENPEIARLMNQYFICIKVDRERRPEIDSFYMSAVEMLSGQGGWPMSVFLTPRGEPFFGGVYFPPDKFTEILERVHELWQQPEERQQMISLGQDIQARLETLLNPASTEALRDDAGDLALQGILADYDSLQGGFGQAIKFPQESWLLFLLRAALNQSHGKAREAVEKTLTEMSLGGIYDQAGGGFHRYSTTPDWLVPHFEKMLYNQALLAQIYIRAYKLTGNPWFARIARQTLDYSLRDMRSPEGLFYSATDADSEGKEGKFFIWTIAQMREALPPKQADLAIQLFSVTEQGNFEGGNILHMPLSPQKYAEKHKRGLPSLLQQLDAIRTTLYHRREKRPHPLRDGKIITAWNAMLVIALAETGHVLKEDSYLEAARRATELLWKNYGQDKTLKRIYWQGKSSVNGTLEDYAWFIQALLAMYDYSTGPAECRNWLKRAETIANTLLEQFADHDNGGFFLKPASKYTTAIKSPADDALPSANAITVQALNRLSTRNGKAAYRHAAERALQSFAAQINAQPPSFAGLLYAAEELKSGETGSYRYAAHGAVKAAASVGQDRLEVVLDIRPGWHINAHKPLQAHLKPTRLHLVSDSVWVGGKVDYPPAEIVALGFSQTPLALYQGRVKLTMPLQRNPQKSKQPARITVELQACSDELCLPPEQIELHAADW